MSNTFLDTILGRPPADEETAEQAQDHVALEIAEQAKEPDNYRPYVTRPRPQMAFAVIEKGGTLHGFMYHQLRHPKHETRGEQEFLSFTADGAAVNMQGTGLRVIALAMLRHCLIEVREYDGKQPVVNQETRIDRLQVVDTTERHLMPKPHLVKDA